MNMAPEEMKRIRRHLGLTQRQLAEALKLGADGGRRIRRWEDGEIEISGPAAVAMKLMEEKHGP